MACDSLPVGKGTDIRIYRMNGNCDVLGSIPNAGYFEVTNGASAATATATTLTTTALLSDIYKGNYLKFVDSVGGTDSLVHVNTDASATDTTLNVDAIPEAVAANAVAQFPPFLGGRTSSSVEQSGNLVSNVVFEDGLFTKQGLTSISSTVSFDGNFLDTDPGMLTLYDAYVDKQNYGHANLYVIITLTAQKAGTYGRGSQWAFQVVPSNASMQIGTEEIVSFNFSGSATGRCVLANPVV